MANIKKLVYPFPCQFSLGSKTFTVSVLRVTQRAMLVNSIDSPLLVHQVYKAQFQLPGTRDHVETDIVVFKTFDEFKGKHGLVKPGHHLNEVLFKFTSVDTKRLILRFLSRYQALRG